MRSRVNVIVLVVLSMIAGGLLVVGIGQIRWRFLRLTESRCKLKNIALSLHSFNDTYKSLPPATVPNPDLPPDKRLSWMFALLPFVEQDSLWKNNDPSKAWDDEGNRQAVHRVVETYLCQYHPSRPVAGLPAPTHYVGLAGVGAGSALLAKGDPRAGLFGHDRTISIPEVTNADGTSNTIAVIDTLCLIGPWAAGGPATVRELLPGLQPYIGPYRQFGGVRDPTFARCAMGDGSTREISDRVSPRWFEAAVTYAGGEKLPSDWNDPRDEEP
jgi:hypothetical protein